LFQSFARLVDLQRLKNVKVDPIVSEGWAPLSYRHLTEYNTLSDNALHMHTQN